ncbi:MAG TPA: NAD-dependent epimerase/dehydratase family protein, partial [Pricia sp.]|nr:NAD-dependent epimerase/dehydratase family protein [Pricia sp.]
NGAYAAVIPKFVIQLVNHETPTINGDGSFSRDFTYIDNVVEANIRSLIVKDSEAINTVYNVAYGERTTLNELVKLLIEYLSKFDDYIKSINVKYGAKRAGDVPHSLASIEKAKNFLGYTPEYDIKTGLQEAVEWYWENLKNDTI